MVDCLVLFTLLLVKQHQEANWDSDIIFTLTQIFISFKTTQLTRDK